MHEETSKLNMELCEADYSKLKQIEKRNRVKGSLNGYHCEICNDKGFVWKLVAGYGSKGSKTIKPFLYETYCECSCVKRREAQYREMEKRKAEREQEWAQSEKEKRKKRKD